MNTSEIRINPAFFLDHKPLMALQADPGRDQRRRVGSASVHAGGLPRGLDEAAARLDEGARRAQASRRDADDPLGGASRRIRRRPRIFPLLRALQRMEKAPLADDAADA